MDEQDPKSPGPEDRPGDPEDNAQASPGDAPARTDASEPAAPAEDAPAEPSPEGPLEFSIRVIEPDDLEIIHEDAAEKIAAPVEEPATAEGDALPELEAEPVSPPEPAEEPPAEIEAEASAPPSEMAPAPPLAAPDVEAEPEAQTLSEIEPEPKLALEPEVAAEAEPETAPEPAPSLETPDETVAEAVDEPDAQPAEVFAQAEPAAEVEPESVAETPAIAEAAPEPVIEEEPEPVSAEAEAPVEASAEPTPEEPEAVVAADAEPEEIPPEEIFEPEARAEESAEAPAEEEEEPEAIAAFDAPPPADAALFETDEIGKTVFDSGEEEEDETLEAARDSEPALDEAPEADVEIIPPPMIVEPAPRQTASEELDAALMRPATPPEPPRPGMTEQIAAAITVILAQLTARLSKRAEPAPAGDEAPVETPAPPAHKPFVFPRIHKPNFRRIAIMAGWMTAGVVVIIAAFFIYLTKDMPSTKSLWTADNSPSLTFVDRHGRVIIREGAESAPPVDLSRLPPYVAQAVIAIEDRRFYDHFGIDVGGLMRATLTNFRAGHVVQGGSTITQQLAKNLFLSNSRTVKRKLQEVALALWLESQFSKRDILALYMSRVYFGAGAYGVEAAAERYFDKPAKNLSLAEAALLAGLVKAPSKLNPAAQDAAAKARAKIVLDEMLSAGFITATQHANALQSPLAISRNNPSGNLGYFRDWIDPQLVAVVGDQRDDFIVETTLDLDAQRAGEVALQTVIDRERKVRNVSQGAVLAMDSTGGVTTMVGGMNYGKAEGQSEFNRTTQSLRAPGSSFKYFIYMTAMDQGITPWAVRVDKPVVIGDWAPGNYEDKYYGPVTLTTAYAKSLNMVAIQLANEVGGQAVIDTAHKLGVGKRLENFRSLGLGAQGMTVMEMVTGYGAMAAGGYPIEPHGIERVRRANGQVLWARRPAKPPVQVIEDRTIRMMNLLGTTVVRAGTGTNARIEGRMIAGKTGTSNDYRDAWFIGYVPGMVAGVWLGNDDNTSMTKVTGGLLATEVWKDLMTVALRDTPIQDLPLPAPEDYPLTTLPAPTEAIPELPPITALGPQTTPAAAKPPAAPAAPARGGDG